MKLAFVAAAALAVLTTAREGRSDRASREFSDLQSGVREGAVRLSGCPLGDAPGRADHFEVETPCWARACAWGT